MNINLEVDGQSHERYSAVPRKLAEILTEKEYDRVRDGLLVAIHEGGIMDLTSPLYDGEIIKLLPLEHEEVQKIVKQCFGNTEQVLAGDK